MCGQCKDGNENSSTRRTLVILVLFSVTLSALGISCFALLTVQKLSKDLNNLRLVLSRTRVEPAKQPVYGFIKKLNRDDQYRGPIYEIPLDGTTERIPNQVRSKRNSGSEPLNKQVEDQSVFEETTFETSTKDAQSSFDPTIRFSNENIDFPIDNVNPEVKTEGDNSGIDFVPGSTADVRGNFDTINKKIIQMNETSVPALETMRIISQVQDFRRITKKNETSQASNPLEEEVETLKPVIPQNDHETTESDNSQRFRPLNRNSNIPSIIEDVQNQMDHNIKKKNVNYDDVESFTPQYNVPRNVYRHRPRGRNGNQLEIIDEFSPQAGRLKSLTAIHLNGDTSQYTLGIHTNYKGNGHLRHPQKTFVDWKMSDWVETISATNIFHLKNGVLTVEESGLYFLYAQIYYLDEHDSNGYMVRKNSENILHCKVTAPSSERLMKGNTCYTGAVVYLDTNDKISLDDISDGRYTLFVPGYSFFGMIRIGDIKGK